MSFWVIGNNFPGAEILNQDTGAKTQLLHNAKQNLSLWLLYWGDLQHLNTLKEDEKKLEIILDWHLKRKIKLGFSTAIWFMNTDYQQAPLKQF